MERERGSPKVGQSPTFSYLFIFTAHLSVEPDKTAPGQTTRKIPLYLQQPSHVSLRENITLQDRWPLSMVNCNFKVDLAFYVELRGYFSRLIYWCGLRVKLVCCGLIDLHKWAMGWSTGVGRMWGSSHMLDTITGIIWMGNIHKLCPYGQFPWWPGVKMSQKEL